jgi:hypothetical protein
MPRIKYFVIPPSVGLNVSKARKRLYRRFQPSYTVTVRNALSLAKSFKLRYSGVLGGESVHACLVAVWRLNGFAVGVGDAMLRHFVFLTHCQSP